MIRIIRSRAIGQILVLVIIVTAIVLANTILIISNSFIFNQNSSYIIESTQALHLAEAGIDKALASLNSSAGNYNGETGTLLDTGSFSVSLSSPDTNTRIITASGFVPSKANARATRTVKVTMARGIGASFKYGVQIGEGGFQLGNNDQVVGSVYSNGSITAGNNNQLNGDIIVAGSTQTLPDQSSDCISSCGDFIFGRIVGQNQQLDVAQSFQPSQSAYLNKLTIELKKVGNPANATVRIVADNAGIPDKNNVLATGTLFSNLVTSSYSFTDVAFDSSPFLNANTSYWLLVDTVADSNNYWLWQSDLNQNYLRGVMKWSPNWQAGTPIWNQEALDLTFKTYMGLGNTYIDGASSTVVTGSVRANTIKGVTINQDAYYQTLVGATAGRYFPNTPDSAPKQFPISDGNILDWQNQAVAAGVYNGNITNCLSTLGPGKYVGDVTFPNSCNVTVKTPVWITGNLTLNNSNVLTLSAEYGNTSGVIITDGIITLGNSNTVRGTGQSPSSILMLLSYYDSRASGVTAIKVSNTGNSAFLYAGRGIIEPGNSNVFKELTGWGIKIFNNSSVNYETGLANAFFTSGPGGAFSLVRGTYQIK